MPELSPYRVAAFVAIAGVLALVGWNSMRSEQVRDRGVLAGGVAGTPDRASVGSPGDSDAGPLAGDRLEFTAGGRRIVVDVSGAVRRPGVYRFEHGQRVIDAIERAGGPTRAALPEAINRAAVLADGQQVVVPSRISAGEGAAAPGGVATGVGGLTAEDTPISLGSATQEQLEQIEGIGPVTAQSILEFRDSQGGVSSIDELDQVSGIGPVTMEALRSRLQP